uniref:Uncharacterized protein n=1 Tax=Arundo donax TaxID=35708 RepID=A0A0A9EYF0_ARUDO
MMNPTMNLSMRSCPMDLMSSGNSLVSQAHPEPLRD